MNASECLFFFVNLCTLFINFKNNCQHIFDELSFLAHIISGGVEAVQLVSQFFLEKFDSLQLHFVDFLLQRHNLFVSGLELRLQFPTKQTR